MIKINVESWKHYYMPEIVLTVVLTLWRVDSPVSMFDTGVALLLGKR